MKVLLLTQNIMTWAPESPEMALSPELRAKFEKLIKLHWTQKQQALWMSAESAEEFWNDMLDDFWKPWCGAFGDYVVGAWMLEEYSEFVNALTTTEALEIQRLLKVGVDAQRTATLTKVSELLRLPTE